MKNSLFRFVLSLTESTIETAFIPGPKVHGFRLSWNRTKRRL